LSGRVLVTGVGVVAPNAIGFPEYSRALRAGRSAVTPIRAFDCRGFATRIAAQVDDDVFDPTPHVHPPKQLKHMSRATKFAVVAADEARRRAGLGRDAVDPARLGVSLGASGMGPTDLEPLLGQAETLLAVCRARGDWHFDLPAFAAELVARTNPIAPLRGLPNLAATSIAIQQDARGPNDTVTTACSSGAQAIGRALGILRHDEADVVLCGGTDAMINPVGVLGFSMLGALSRRNDEPARASRPFDRDRDGFVLGEGAAILVLEREEFARARGARPLAELAGYGCSCDAYRITDERPDGSQAVRAMLAAIADAGLFPRDVDYVNAHGTGTLMNDRTETLALGKAFGSHAQGLRVSSTKSMIGHTLAAAGALEAAACLAGIEDGFVPPTINLETPDPDCHLDYVPNHASETAFDVALSNSFGFGGQNACLILKRA